MPRRRGVPWLALRSFYLKPMNYIKKNEVVLLEWLLCIRRDISKVPSLFYRSLGAHFYLVTHLFVREVFSLCALARPNIIACRLACQINWKIILRGVLLRANKLSL
jgi:hypothetical protein